jgi:hypothetical protein
MRGPCLAQGAKSISQYWGPQIYTLITGPSPSCALSNNDSTPRVDGFTVDVLVHQLEPSGVAGLHRDPVGTRQTLQTFHKSQNFGSSSFTNDGPSGVGPTIYSP